MGKFYTPRAFWSALCLSCCALLLLTGCQTQKRNPQFADLPGTTPPAAKSAPVKPVANKTAPTGLTPTAQPVAAKATNSVFAPSQPIQTKTDSPLRVGQSLMVTFSDTPIQLAPYKTRVNEEGKITLIYNESFQAAGKTLSELETAIRERYQGRYFVRVTVAVEELTNPTLFYYVDGEVRAPSRQPYIERTTVLKVIASCGGFTEFANKKNIRLTRADGRVQTVNYLKALDEPRLDPEVFAGDKIYVKRKFW
jgi:protein involved in polysaccharide export with SLBB domain